MARVLIVDDDSSVRGTMARFAIGARCVLALMMALMLSAHRPLADQAPPAPQNPVFRTRTDVVRLDVSVFDRERRPVRDLSSREFSVFENGAPQEIVVFEPVVMPDEVHAETAFEREAIPDVVTNAPADGRLWVMMLDDATAKPDLWALRAVKGIGRSVVQQLSVGDRMAVLFPRNNLNARDFTGVRPHLFAAIEAYDLGYYAMGKFKVGGFGAAEAAAAKADEYFKAASVKTLRAAVDYLSAQAERRRVLVYVGYGVDVDFAPEPRPGVAVDLSLVNEVKALLEDARRAGISVYAFNACGLGGKNCTTSKAVEFLQVVSNETGGRATVGTNDFEPGIRQMFVENQSYYLMGYRTTTLETTGYRRIEVKVNRPDVEVRTRTGYFAETERERARAAEARARLAPPVAALTGILPQSDLPLRLTAAPFARRGSRDAQVAMVLGAELPGVMVPRTGRAVETLSVETRAFTPEGHARGEWRQRVDVTLRPPVRGAEPTAEVLTRVQLRPGRYTLRVGAHGREVGLAGSVYADVDVPDFANAPVALSGVVLSVEPREAQAGERSVSGWLPVVPTAVRTFTARHVVTSFVQVSQGGRTPLEAVTLTRRLVDGAGTVVLDETETLAPARFGAARAAEVLWRVPTADLAPGLYLLRLTATRGTDTVTRDVVFRRE